MKKFKVQFMMEDMGGAQGILESSSADTLSADIEYTDEDGYIFTDRICVQRNLPSMCNFFDYDWDGDVDYETIDINSDLEFCVNLEKLQEIVDYDAESVEDNFYEWFDLDAWDESIYPELKEEFLEEASKYGLKESDFDFCKGAWG